MLLFLNSLAITVTKTLLQQQQTQIHRQQSIRVLYQQVQLRPADSGDCKSGFSLNEAGNCIKDGPCPSGTARKDFSETGKCIKIKEKAN